MGKGEIAHYEQFLLFSQCFQKTSTAHTWKPGLVWERVKNIGGKGENAGNHFPQCYLYYQRKKCNKWAILKMSTANAFGLDWSKILSIQICGKTFYHFFTFDKVSLGWNQGHHLLETTLKCMTEVTALEQTGLWTSVKQDVLVKHECTRNHHFFFFFSFSKTVTLIYDLYLDRWPWLWY